MRKYFLISASLFAVVLLVGCSSGGTTTTTTTSTETTTETVAESTLWTNDVDAGSIGDSNMYGWLNYEDFELAYVSIDNWGDEYSWTFSNLAPDSTCGIVFDDDAVRFSSKDLQEGTLVKEMDDDPEFDEYYAYYYYQDEDGWPYSMNTDWSARIVVESIDEDAMEDEWGSTVGLVTGWAEFEFGDDLETWVSGSFTAELCDYTF
ncbi:MAG: hypothetical protein Q8P27_02840 [Candidatus Peregrinibacteria bacterium]|nr:hypothetical protein [Candidatus Peregrinibacteria bacterium]